MATPHRNYPVTVNQDAYNAFMGNKQEHMKKAQDFSVTHSEFLLLIIAKYKKEVNRVG